MNRGIQGRGGGENREKRVRMSAGREKRKRNTEKKHIYRIDIKAVNRKLVNVHKVTHSIKTPSVINCYKPVFNSLLTKYLV